MSADRETNHVMSHDDITHLLADAADQVEIGIAPTQAVIRGGRRRRARRWAIAAVTSVVVTASTGALAVTGLPGGDDGHRVTPTATSLSDTFQPATTVTLATGSDGGRPWKLSVDAWPAPGDVEEAQALLNAMRSHGEEPAEVDEPSDLLGRSAYFVRLSLDEPRALGRVVLKGVTTESDAHSGDDLVAHAKSLDDPADPHRLVIGRVAETAQRVTCTWKDGTTTEVRRAELDRETGTNTLAIRSVVNSPYDWFVCLAPQGTEFRDAKVTG
ncbi:hypothetical protein [Streptomyces sp. NPDC018693]|uniref:hypothetical protein n=1 Tax=unclassified Streptomyces TaxID=2593676 RepID=UPI0037B9345B